MIYLTTIIFFMMNKNNLSIKKILVLLFILFTFIILVLWGGQGSIFDIFERAESYDFLILMEGYYVSSIANFLFTNNLQLEPTYLLSSILFLFPGIKNLFVDFDSSIFHKMYTNIFFQKAEHGMAYNPFIEAYSTLGYSGVFIFCICISILGFLFNDIYRKSNSIWRFYLITIGIIFFFFIHRNSLHVTITIFSYMSHLQIIKNNP